MRLSKSRYMAGLQCHRQLWWRAHEPDAPELAPDPDQEALFDQGTRVGLAARERVPGGVAVDLPHAAIDERLAATGQALDGGARVIYEASFMADDTFAAVDILERIPRGWRLIEVKSSARLKEEHLPDVAVQLHVLRRAGLPVQRAEVMHLNRACAYPRLENLFLRADVTTRAEEELAAVPGEIARQLEMLRGPIPAVPIGPHCLEPYACPFRARCWPEPPAHHISTLYYVGRGWWDLAARGITTIPQLPADFVAHPAAERQRRAIRTGAMVVDPGLGPALDALRGPLAILDFETVAPAIPVWDGCHPYDAVPAQFSCHRQDGHGGWEHHEWITRGPTDPRPELARRLTDACRGARTVLAYHSDFEAYCLRLMRDALPEWKTPLQDVLDRLADALPLVRDHVYHPDFGGGFGLKAVLPVMVPELDYAGLEIADGVAASRELERLLFEGGRTGAGERQRREEALRRYCRLDTWGVVRLLERLSELARADRSGL